MGFRRGGDGALGAPVLARNQVWGKIGFGEATRGKRGEPQGSMLLASVKQRCRCRTDGSAGRPAAAAAEPASCAASCAEKRRLGGRVVAADAGAGLGGGFPRQLRTFPGEIAGSREASEASRRAARM